MTTLPRWTHTTMIHKSQSPCKAFLSFAIPKGLETVLDGPMADDLAKFSYLLLLFSIPYKERREKGFYIPFSKATGWRYFNKRWPALRQAMEGYKDVFDWNEKYLNDDRLGFPKSVRLTKPYRSGECVLYTTKKKYNKIHHIDYDSLDEPSRRLLADFDAFRLPEEMPDFTNPWQAITWDAIAKGDYYAKRCEYGRFHSNFTSFKHRHLLLCDRGPLAVLDVKSAQMLCLASVVRRWGGRHPDITKWLEICKDGDIYQYLADILGKTRKEAKNGLIRCVFERTHKMVRMPEFIALQDHFGYIAQCILEIKKANGYRDVARACQRVESKIMINKALMGLPGVPIITCHDEFILPADSLEPAKLSLRRAFRDYGLSPSFKTKVA